MMLTLLWRESRGAGRRFLFFVACLAVGVAAVVCVAGLAANLDQRIRSEARQLLAADLVVAALRPLPTELEEFLQQHPELEVTRIRELVTVAMRPAEGESPGRSQLVELKALDGDYPFYGQLESDPQLPLRQLLAEDRLVVAPDLLTRLGLQVGDSLRVGNQDFRIAGLVLREPDRIATPLSLGPRIFMSGSGFARTELEQLGSRIVYRALIKLPADSRPADLETLAEELRVLLGKTGPFRVQTYVESQEEMRRALQRAASFLGLVALLSLLLGGLGIAQTTRSWLAGRMDDIAILRCLGLRPNDVMTLYLGQATLLGLAGSLAGLMIGVAILATLPSLFGEILGAAPLDLWQPAVLLKGLALGLGIALLFSLRALVTVRQVPPLRVLRQDVEPLPGSRRANLAMIVILGLGVWAVASIQAGSPVRGLQFAAGISVASALLAGVALLAMRNLAPVARRARTVWLRQGVLALARPGAATLGAVVSLGIGVLLILGLQLVKNRLSDELRGQLPENSPTAFLINIQPAQWPEVEQLLAESGAQQIASVPIVTARLRQIDGREISEMALDETERDRRWALTREQRLTYMEALPADNRIIAGALWSDPETAEVSVEEEFAGELGVEVGSTLLFDIQGVPFELHVTSLRTVEWRTFGINFFLVVEPGVLDDAPQQRVATVRLPREQEQSVQDRLANRFPNITLLKIREVLERIAAVLGYLASGVGFVGAFTAVAGIVILAGGVTADSVRRRKHIALLKTLGMTQRQISAMLAVEFAVVGMIAGLIGTAGGSLLAWAVLTRGLELRWSLQPAVLAAAFLITLLLTAATGILASRHALRQRPAAVLRGE